MKQSFIGITPRFITNNETGIRAVKINMDYINQIINYNKVPLILFDDNNLEENLKLCEGFFLLGGDDIDPKYYGEDNLEGLSKDIDEYTDTIDKKIIEYAVANKVPTIGICRGHQDLAAFLGGTLYQDIPTANLEHPSEDKKHYVTKITRTELLDRLPDTFLVNTFHHQAVKDVAPGFIATLVNHDVIEAMEHTTLPIISVQWHPERYYTNESKIIFDYFYELVEQYKK